MADSIATSCPECKKTIKVAAEFEGKRIRCKECGTAFPVKRSGKADPDAVPRKTSSKGPPAGKGKAAAPAAQPPKAPPKPADDDEDGDGKAYGMTATDDGVARCPDCANAMESEDAVVCLFCGYNTMTRTRAKTIKTIEHTPMEKVLWLLPGVCCVFGIFVALGFVYYYHAILPGVMLKKWDETLAKEGGRMDAISKMDDFTAYLFHPGIEIWIAVIALFASYKMGMFAYKRLVVNYKPPEKFKEK